MDREYIREYVVKKVDAIFAEETGFSAYKVRDWEDYIVEIIEQLYALSAFDNETETGQQHP